MGPELIERRRPCRVAYTAGQQNRLQPRLFRLRRWNHLLRRRIAIQRAHIHRRRPFHGDAGQPVGRERQRKVHAIYQCACAHPVTGIPLVSRRRHASIQRHPHLAQRIRQRLKVLNVGVAGARRAHHKFQRRLHLGPKIARGPELRRMEEGLEHRGNVAAGRQIRLRHAVHQSLGRIVAHKADGQLARKELRRGRPHGQHVQQLAALHLAVLFDLCAQHRFRSALVALRREYKVSAELRPIDGPAGQHARHLRHVGLRVAAIHAQRMQFHQLARIILIQPGVGFLFRIGPPRCGRFRALGCRRIRPHANPQTCPAPAAGLRRARSSPGNTASARSCAGTR